MWDGERKDKLRRKLIFSKSKNFFFGAESSLLVRVALVELLAETIASNATVERVFPVRRL